MIRTGIYVSGCERREADCGDMRGILSFVEEDYTAALPETQYEGDRRCLEIRLLVRGIQPVIIEGEELTLHGGDMLILQEGLPFSTLHRLQYRAMYLILYIDLSSIRVGSSALLDMSMERSALCAEKIGGMCDICYTCDENLIKLMCGSLEDLLKEDETVRMRGKARLMCFLCSLPIDAKKQKLRAYSKVVRQALRCINDSSSAFSDVAELAELTGTSPSYFKSVFTREVGVSPLYYINWRRIASAKRLIAQGYPVTEVAISTGFNSSAYFSTVFKNYTSRTPQEYRRFVEEELRKQRHNRSIGIPEK